MSRNPLLAKIHIAKKQINITDDDYRAMLLRITGHKSSSLCSDLQLHAVLEEFKRLGFKAKTSPSGAGRSSKPYIRKIFALWADAVSIGAISDGSRSALLAFIKRQSGVDAPDWLTIEQANKVSEGLKAIIKRARHD
jgi:phage gp16-like protein